MRAALLRAWCSQAVRILAGLALVALGVALLAANRSAPSTPVLGASLGLVLFGGLVIDPAFVLARCKDAAAAARDVLGAFRLPPDAGGPS